VQLGFRPDHVLTFQLAPPPAKYAGQARQWGLYRDMLEAIRTLPGVRDAAISSGIPLGVGSYTRTPMSATGRSVLPAGAAIPIDWRTVSPGFFRTLEIPLLAGRDFNEQDTPDKPPAPATLVTVHAAAPPVGLLEVTTVLPLPTATHSRTLGHETPFRLDAPIRLLSVHAVSLPVGFVEVITLPARFAPAHSVLLGHEMLLKALPEPTSA
jgi:hypothetical protein